MAVRGLMYKGDWNLRKEEKIEDQVSSGKKGVPECLWPKYIEADDAIRIAWIGLRWAPVMEMPDGFEPWRHESS